MKKNECSTVQIGEQSPLYNCGLLRVTFPRRLFLTDFMFVQGLNNEAENILKKHDVRSFKPVHLIKHNGWPRYSLFTCQVNVAEVERFINAMYELQRNMLLLGYRDYPEACAAIFESVGAETL